ncbi:signal recognition particle-docking protein FtsY [Thauera linaloolentis]|uniref:Signal recognition particle receptor FtsY n=1 Tax=Thauera linaloolentis (strain DSM 12138 / JCM 21573 / CCUG 41526 / CIP 105981 / IAM 15112 / NBRC 102519 / 47Lol) TaxID=1123367 RepID=N6ZAC3_THAL4|nr:signal recognition particle-docking protein FtsY [Thauera linaloolentis]ENO89139.1 signal recognition particle-docking protein FtsY [Thauera linaloolentis 47Lol = DSM 12138]MCM8565714.1 signal recognition particle-docking protein FtsY [Thauera linaloolentis]
MFGFLKKKFGKAEQAEVGQPDAEDVAEKTVSDAAPAAAQGVAVEEAPAAGLQASAPEQVPEAPEAPEAASESVEPPDPASVPATAAVPATSGDVTPEGSSETSGRAEAAGPADAAEPVESIEAVVPVPAEAPARRSWSDRLKAGLSRTRQQLGGGLASLFGRRKIDEDLLEELESTLLMADCGVEATQHLIDELRLRWKRDRLETADQLQKALADGLHAIIAPLEQPLDAATHRPFVIMIAGVNGSGKTTSIGKLAKYFQAQGKSVLLAAGDTFRAAAREQLMTWGERNNVTVVAQDGGDAAAVIFDAINAARARNIDVVLADTAGRLPTQLHLMEEIAKVRRVIAKADPSAPHEVLLVLDANIGQNALAQVKAFDKAIGVTGLVVTKLDGTAKGGVLAAIARQCPKPLRFIGVGEGIDDLQPFKAREFVDALFEPAAGAGRSGAARNEADPRA